MDENALHQWFINCFGPVQGEMAFSQFNNLPEEIREQLLSRGSESLPDPQQVQSLMQAFMGGGMNSFGEMQQTISEGPINVKLAKSIALQRVNSSGSESSVTAEEGATMRRAMSEANLWLDIATAFNPPAGEAEPLTRAGWVEGTIDAWAQFAAPVAASMNEALSAVISDRLGDAFEGEITGMYAGPVPIPIPDGMKDPKQLMKLFANTSYAMQLGQAAGALSLEVRGSFDQGIRMLDNPAGGLIMQNVDDYATSLEFDASEVTEFLALREQAYARLYASVPWLMPRFTALIGKYARASQSTSMRWRSSCATLRRSTPNRFRERSIWRTSASPTLRNSVRRCSRSRPCSRLSKAGSTARCGAPAWLICRISTSCVR